jgi:hypothetical protein
MDWLDEVSQNIEKKHRKDIPRGFKKYLKDDRDFFKEIHYLKNALREMTEGAIRMEGYMKKVLLVVAFVLAMAGVASAAGPYLVCDPYTAADGITSFNVIIDSGTPISASPVNMALHYDLSSLANGAHSVVAQACNTWGCSANSSPLAFTKGVPAMPTNLKLSTQ